MNAEEKSKLDHVYFVSYQWSNKRGTRTANGEILMDKEIDNYQKVTAIEQFLLKQLRKQGRNPDRVVLLSWIPIDKSPEPMIESEKQKLESVK